MLFSSSWRLAEAGMTSRAIGHSSPGMDGFSCPSTSLAIAAHFSVSWAIPLLDWPLTAARRNFAIFVLRSRQLKLFIGRSADPLRTSGKNGFPHFSELGVAVAHSTSLFAHRMPGKD